LLNIYNPTQGHVYAYISVPSTDLSCPQVAMITFWLKASEERKRQQELESKTRRLHKSMEMFGSPIPATPN
jgi:hypothetical protein